ncbi:hypothetical protein C8N24_0722 [Solirubrobacter pauli]|uniref:Uncharacterized protein n=1 Tax=Solirubrobacter pauli TaxID=166793 RepID=A0A660L790_9ACTN|nr:hypothetical protein [Solirubrobacter pauli]RKQ90907.1 hypothetical protein C8N24_0722 [Solirubrobacter pauli]
MPSDDAHARILRSVGLSYHDGLWRDDADALGAVVTPAGTFVGWLDVTWLGPSEPRPVLRETEHVLRGLPDGCLSEALGTPRIVERTRFASAGPVMAASFPGTCMTKRRAKAAPNGTSASCTDGRASPPLHGSVVYACSDWATGATRVQT